MDYNFNVTTTASAKFEKPLLKAGAFFISIILPHIKIWIELDRF